jgi:plasmid stability protein
LTLDLDEALMRRLRERAARNARSVEAEAAILLKDALQLPRDPWAAVRAIHDRLAATGRDFGDSVEILHVDRGR